MRNKGYVWERVILLPIVFPFAIIAYTVGFIVGTCKDCYKRGSN